MTFDHRDNGHDTAVYFVCSNWQVIFGILAACFIFRNYFRLGLSSLPGPLSRSFSSFPRLLSVYRGHSHDDDIALHRRYGSIVRIAPNLVSVSDPRELRTIYRAGSTFRKGSFYSVVEAYDDEGLVPDPFVITNREHHARLKRGAAGAYSLSSMVRLEPYVDDVTRRLVQKLKGVAAKGQALDFAPLLQAYAMDAVSALTLGKDFNHMDAGDHLGFLRASAVINAYLAIIGQIPCCHRFLLGNSLLARYFDCTEGNEQLFALIEREMDESRNRPDANGPMTFLQRLVGQQNNSPSSINDREIITNCFNNLGAGSDTTAIALRSIIYHTLRNPEAHRRLVEEVRCTFSHGDISFATANKLPYLGAVIKESLRLHPSVGMMLVRVVPNGGATICGKHLSAGVEVGINPWVLHRDPQVFPDPDLFVPERWLPEVSDEDRLKQMNRSWIPFGHGAHTCSGRWSSWMEMYKLTATLFFHFDMHLADQGRGYAFRNLWLTPQTGLNVAFAEGSLTE
ncbi:cytochrome P450 oxidoreductase [Plectosphaerella plurivora]|uniref:Cytochrome P450 oxidoreductase n=1 Tax=Plectosphaerella plurivora TaxID=936078 RepID=A0A9P9A4T7_9PEZI|nr:cytochrome P450 oxidoreductase [Plectosphaerella plurivora]